MGARRALITGITGQDGSFLAELLLEKGYEVLGTIRGQPDDPLGCSEHLRERISLLAADLEQPASLRTAIAEAQPDELYHLAAPSFVPYSWQHPAETLACIAGSTAALLEAVCTHSPDTRTFVAASGAIFGDARVSPQRESTPCRPQTPYATAKLASYQLVGQMRAHDDLFACSGILYNHESERRPERFVARKITRAAAAIKLGLADHVTLGDLDAVRDWSFAGDIVRGAWLMLQQDVPDDCILASGTPHTVSDLANVAFSHVGLDAGRCVRVDPDLVRAAEATPQVGDPSRARKRLGWQPTLDFEQLVQRMVEHDLQDLG
ncbi:MAG: GDP-mannose 4,6-dehydratase [Solirubrobacteraceae bacterium]